MPSYRVRVPQPHHPTRLRSLESEMDNSQGLGFWYHKLLVGPCRTEARYDKSKYHLKDVIIGKASRLGSWVRLWGLGFIFLTLCGSFRLSGIPSKTATQTFNPKHGSPLNRAAVNPELGRSLPSQQSFVSCACKHRCPDEASSKLLRRSAGVLPACADQD